MQSSQQLNTSACHSRPFAILHLQTNQQPVLIYQNILSVGKWDCSPTCLCLCTSLKCPSLLSLPSVHILPKPTQTPLPQRSLPYCQSILNPAFTSIMVDYNDFLQLYFSWVEVPWGQRPYLNLSLHLLLWAWNRMILKDPEHFSWFPWKYQII